MMQSLSQGDIVKRLKHAGIAGTVQASMAVEAFRLYLQSEFPEVTTTECEPMFVRDSVLVIRSTNPALMQTLREHEPDIARYIEQVCGSAITRLQFRAN